MAATSINKLVEMKNISKTFGGIHALQNVSVDLQLGEVVGLLGHNGAGKSTLIKILSGAYSADEGEILINGQHVTIRTPRDAKHHGIETIYQHLALAENLAAPANIFLGRELTTRTGALDDDRMEAEAQKILNRLDLKIKSLRESVRNLSGGQRQAIAISRAIYFNAKILIMDEPTAALGPQETLKVKQLIISLKKEGLGIFLISHDMHDVFDVCDRVSVMHNGKLVATVKTSDVTKDDVLGMIILGQKPASMKA
ncbi:MAG: ATP-binding cassette domain-containing protein [Trueperaceae bacterium]